MHPTRHMALAALVVLSACASPGVDEADTEPPSLDTPIVTTNTVTVVESQPPAASSSSSEQPPTTSTTTTVAPTTIKTTPSSSAESAPLPQPTRVFGPGMESDEMLQIIVRFDSRVAEITTDEFATAAMAILNDERGWRKGGFEFVQGDDTSLSIVLAEGPEIDALCLPLQTRATVSCQNGATVGLNADRWRVATEGWDGPVETYRIYLVNHELGHLIGLRHPTPRCPIPGAPAAVMEPQTGGLAGCVGNGWPRHWEIDYALVRPAMIGPLPDWAPDPVPQNLERPAG